MNLSNFVTLTNLLFTDAKNASVAYSNLSMAYLTLQTEANPANIAADRASLNTALLGISALSGHRYTVGRARGHAAGSRSGMHPSASRTSESDQT